MLDLEELPVALVHRHRERSAYRSGVADRRSTSHAVTCDYLVGRGHRVCSCDGPRAGGR